MMAQVAGGAGIGLVWGWLFGPAVASPRRRWAAVSVLAVPVAHISTLGPAASGAACCAAVACGAALRAAWHALLRRRIRSAESA